MTCEEAREAFTDLYDGTLSGPPWWPSAGTWTGARRVAGSGWRFA